LRVRALFIELAEARVRSIVSSVEESSDITISTTLVGGSKGALAELLDRSDCVFVNRGQKESKLIRLLETVRRCRADIPVVLTYGTEPDGKSYLLANRFDCWLFSEKDHLQRTLTSAEIGEALRERTKDVAVEQRLLEVSLCAGPCSTGS
jgi:hypothetical protein